METRIQRRNAVQWVLRVTKNTYLEPKLYERQLLAQYIRGVLTIEQAIDCLQNATVKSGHDERPSGQLPMAH